MNSKWSVRATMAVCAALMASRGWAVDIDTDNEDWSVRFDNTVKFSSKFRTKKASPALTDSLQGGFPQALNFNAGDQNFSRRGWVSERLDLLSEFDAVFRNDFGFRVSAASWYDHALHRNSNAPSDNLNGQVPANEFPARTRRIAGGDAEVMDAFVFGGWRLGNGMKLTGRLGRHALQWGETLFFGDNGIARAQGPIDIDKLLALPNAQFKEYIRPVPQVSGNFQISPGMSMGAYYQFSWEADRLPPAGSYFSNANIPWYSSQPQFTSIGTSNYVLTNRGEAQPRSSGQYGVQLKLRAAESDLGVYYARYHDKAGQLYSQLNPAGTPGPFGTLPGSYYWVFPESIRTYGGSVSHSFGDVNLAAEGSVRDNVPLRSTNMLYGFFPGQLAPQYAKGKTAHLNVSALATFGPGLLARESSLVAELAWNRVLHANDPDGELDKGRTRDATALQFVFSPSYRQVLPGLDISVPIGARYVLSGRSSIAAWDAKGNGSANVGIEGNYLNTWQFALNYTHYIGNAVPFVDYSPILSGGVPRYGWGNALADRNFVALSVRRTF